VKKQRKKKEKLGNVAGLDITLPAR